MMDNDFINAIRRWGESDARIDGILLVGSYARGAQTTASDVDLVIITPHKAALLSQPDFIGRFGEVKEFSVEMWGACTSIRVHYRQMEVEFGFVEPSWMNKPLDGGTRRVLEDGYRVILDKRHYFDGAG